MTETPTVEECQKWADMARLIAHSGYTAYTFTLVGSRAPIVTDAYNRMKNPRVGDLVLETSTYYREPWDPGGLGYLLEVADESLNWPADVVADCGLTEPPTERAWYIKPFVPTQDGQWRVRWSNANFIALPDSLRWVS